MTDTKTKIAAGLEACFRTRGFSEPGVDALRDAADVSLRTLYKYFPSREDMVAGALDHRHDRYLAFLSEGMPASGPEAIDHVFARLEEWLLTEDGVGCLFVNALAAHPDNSAIRAAVERQKSATCALIARCAGQDARANPLFLLHEGATAAWPLLGPEAIRTARRSAAWLMSAESRNGFPSSPQAKQAF